HLVQQQLIQGLLLAGAGAALGCLLVVEALPSLLALYSTDGQPPIEVANDWRILTFVASTMIATAVMSAVVPAVQVHRTSFSGGVADAAAGRIGAGPWERRVRGILVTAQIALAIVLLCASGALLTSLDRLLRASPGFRADGVLTMQLMLPPVRYPDAPARARFVARLLDAVGAVPGIAAAGTTQTTFMPNESMQTLLWIDGRSIESGQPDTSNIRHVTPGYFRALFVPIVEGRAIDERDRIGTPPVCMVSASFARQFWPHESGVGHRVRRTGPTAQWMTVVGIAGDVMDAGAGVSAGPTLYVPYLQANTATARITLTARANGDPIALAGPVRQAIWTIDPLLPVDRISRLDDLMVASAGDHRFRTTLLTIFALIGLAVALVGVHGVTAAAVESRTREMGVRLALGANPAQLVRGLVVETSRLLSIGAAAGVIAFTLFGRVLKQLLYQTSSVPLGVVVAAVLLMAAGALGAAYLRARPLLRLSPTIAIRSGT